MVDRLETSRRLSDCGRIVGTGPAPTGTTVRRPRRFPRFRPDPFTPTAPRADEPVTTEAGRALATHSAENLSPIPLGERPDVGDECASARFRAPDRILVVDDDPVIGGLVRDRDRKSVV
jgi:hypothetical protein